ncbi:MAG: methyltransferase domain-containing protein [Candidatus Vogelbacteria bacterium]|nr:methyltransferase domain-containing protein [Candidatus Vogelbacteria bacterium]
MKQQITEQLGGQKERWGSRAANWDKEIEKPDHYTNFENGYQRFLDLERELLDKIPKKEVGIDIGCGTGVTSKILAEKVETIYLLDLSDRMLAVAKEKVPQGIMLESSASNIPLPDNSVDVAISRGVIISHLPADLIEGFFAELVRILKFGGMTLFDFINRLDTADFKIESDKNVFSREQMATELEKGGFANINFDGEENNRVVRVWAIKK